MRRLLLLFLFIPALAQDWDPDRTLFFGASTVVFEDDSYDNFASAGRQDQALLDAFLAAGVPRRRTVLLLDEDAKLERIRGELTALLKKSRRGEMLVFYFQGHGLRKDGHTWLAPYDAGGPWSTCLQVSEVFDRIEEDFRGDRVLLIGDCCHSGGLAEEAGRRESGISYGVLASCPSYELSTGNWTFTACIVEALRGEGRYDRDGDGVVELGELAQEAEETLAFKEQQLARFATTGDFPSNLALASARAVAEPFVKSQLEAWDGEGWYRAEVLKVDDRGRAYVHYIGYDAKYDEWLGLERLRPWRPELVPVGARVTVREDGKDYTATVTAERLGLHRMRYDGWDAEWDDWLPAARLQASTRTWQPARTWVFAVGVLAWQDGERFPPFPKRDRQDRALVELLKERGVPAEQVVFLTDRQARTERVERELAGLLDKTAPGDFLIVYYAGHGYRDADDVACFATWDAGETRGWRVPDLVAAVADGFSGQAGLLLADCCDAGSLLEALGSRPGVPLAGLTSSRTRALSTGSWTFTESLIDGFGGSAIVDADADGSVALGELAAHAEAALLARDGQLPGFGAGGGFPARLTLADSGGEGGWVGSYVEMWDGDRWQTAHVLALGREGLEVREVGESRGDTLVGLDALRFPRPLTLPPGTPVEVLSAGKWYRATVLASRRGLHRVTYAGWDSSWDEWVPPERVRW